MTNANTIEKKYIMPRLGIKLQTLAAIIAIALAVALPQLIHIIGLVTGTGSSLGEVLLPMHLPVLMVGFMAGPFAGFLTGLLAPAISFALTGMPSLVMLPFITIELAAYGLVSGLIRNINTNAILKVLISQLAGRGIRAVAILIVFYGFGGTVAPAVILTSIAVGLIGIIIQLTLIPAMMRFIARAK